MHVLDVKDILLQIDYKFIKDCQKLKDVSAQTTS